MTHILPSPKASYYPIQLNYIYGVASMKNWFDNGLLNYHERGLGEKTC